MGTKMKTMLLPTRRLGKPESPSFFIPKGALTHHLRSRRWYPSLRSGRALFPKHPSDASPEGAANAAVFQTAVIACAAGRGAAAPFAALQQTLVPSRDKPPPACENLPPAALSQKWTLPLRHRPLSFVCGKRNKTAPCRGQKGSERLWQSITLKPRW